MRIYPVSSNYQRQIYPAKKASIPTCQNPCCDSFNPSFQSTKSGGKKLLGGLFGTAALIGSLIGTAILSGGVSIPFVLGYTALGTAAGVGIGHQIDKGADEEINKIDEKA